MDRDAEFLYVPSKEVRDSAKKQEATPYDVPEVHFTHEGELCTFEVMLARFEITDAALRPIAEIVHDIDLKDEKHGRRETAGIEAIINGIAMAHREDEARLTRASALLDDLYEYFKRKRRSE